MKYLWSPWRMPYIQSKKSDEECVFCSELSRIDGEGNLIIYRGLSNFLILNRYPYTSGHLMIVPNTHVSTLEQLDEETSNEMMKLAKKTLLVLDAVYHPQGYNMGINIGQAAGAGITEHVHMHIVPRWVGDTNFMSALNQTRVLPETLEETYGRISKAWRNHLTQSP